MLETYKKIYMIGIGGISMSAIAEYLSLKNFDVYGSDRQNSKIIERLKNKNIKIFIGHDEKNIDSSFDLVVYTAAIHDDNPEIKKAKNLNLKLISRAELLGMIIDEYKYSVAVAGSHGKTSVTAMISEILIKAKKDPTIFVGGILPSINENFRFGLSQYFVMEACEYCDSFLNFRPYISVINNIDLDHMDYFKNLEQIQKSFIKFADNTKKDGSIIINKNYADLLKNSKNNLDKNKKIILFGDKNSDWYAEDIIFDDNQCAEFLAINKNQVKQKIKLKIPGKYNILNALAAISATYELGINLEGIKNALENFHGVERRFELKGFFKNAKIIDDYAHHPNEITETLLTAKKMPHKNLLCVFQSHTYTRTKEFLNEFAEALSIADKIILVDIYSAREKNIYNISAEDLAKKINQIKNCAIYLKTFDLAAQYLAENIQENDLILTIGAGDVYKIGEILLDKYQNI